MRNMYVYIATNSSRTLYVGVTNDLERRMLEHRKKLYAGFTQKYNITQLVYYESGFSPRDAIAREKMIKGWTRMKKIALVESANPDWIDIDPSFPQDDDLKNELTSHQSG